MSTVVDAAGRVRHRVRVTGVVQGVGFRPFTHRLARELALDGLVWNDTEGVLAEIEGSPADVEQFERRLVDEPPSLARIRSVRVTAMALTQESGFRILDSRGGGDARTFVAPDVAVCGDCLAELFDPGDRRHRYPFINCTNCGPRFTITISLPYDRPNTTMAGFELCARCEQEYHDPADRRFHAQPVACSVCGPRLWLEWGTATVEGTEPALRGAHQLLAGDGIVAIKGLGGYHLACDATSARAVSELRRRKGRPDKPLAVMVRDLAAARRVALIDDDEAALLAGPQRPVVLLAKQTPSPLASQVAPANPYVGVILPYTPLHHLLFRPVAGSPWPVPTALVMTSGNLSDEPICFDDGDARDRLGHIADAWLAHDRPIHVPCDDSVVRVEAGEALPVRRSRGYAPLPVELPFAVEPVLAVGGELKNAFCLASGRDAWMSQHIGDMGSHPTRAAFERSIRQFTAMYHVEPVVVAADLHPGYQSRDWAESTCQQPVTLVQHHHAHIAAVMAEHAVAPGERVIGFAFDGTGYGPDGTIWGGEVLVTGYGDYERAAHLRAVPLPGGDAAIRKPYRAALAHLWAAGIDWARDLCPVRAAPTAELDMIGQQLAHGVGCVPTSSMGRLFDAVSALIGLRQQASFEAQAAIELERVATAYRGPVPRYGFARNGASVDPTPVLSGIVADVRAGRTMGSVAAGFHQAVATFVADTGAALAEETGVGVVALSGGVFQNLLLTRLARAALGDRGLTVFTHRAVPPNDGGLALGQAAVAGFRHGGAAR
jgi:hydrogenase maturation protein HypF